MKKQLFACLLLCLSLVVSAYPSFAQDKARQSNDPIAQLLRDGWKIVQDGVLQRERGAHQVETYVFGAPGFVWKLQDLQRQLRDLRAALLVNPTPELRKTIASQRIEIANTQKLIALAHAAELNGDTAPLPDKTSCSINFGYNANAVPLTSVQGVTATASANFTGTCGFTGEVYAYSYSTAVVSGGSTTQTLTDGPRSGANVTASSYTSQTGGPTCTSYAYASMTSSSLSPSSYTIASTNNSCPVVADPVPAITGPSYIYSFSGCTSWTWTASATSGTPGYSYTWTWNGSTVATGASYSRSVCAGGVATDTFSTLGLTATDSASRTGVTSLSVEVYKGGTGGGGGGGCFVGGGGTVCP
jgi:hypothetical protein